MRRSRKSRADAGEIRGLAAMIICRCGHAIGRHDSLGCKPCLFDQTGSEVCVLAQADIIEIDCQNRERPQE
jgi:hypothetical protein